MPPATNLQPTISSMLLPVQSASPLIGLPSDPYSPASRTKPKKKKNSAPLKVVNDDPSTCKISDNLEDSCKTYCKICNEAFFNPGSEQVSLFLEPEVPCWGQSVKSNNRGKGDYNIFTTDKLVKEFKI